MTESRLNMVDFARNLARRGLREDALLILELLPEPPAIETLDLRARLLAQLGRYAEAEDCWQQVQTQSPDHLGASEGLAAVAGLRRSPLRRLRVALALRFCRVAGTFLALLLVAALALGAEMVRRRFDGLRQSQETLASHLADRDAAVDVVLGKLRQDAADLANLQLRTGDALTALKADQDAMRKEVAAKLEATRKGVTEGLGQTAAALRKDVAAVKAETDKLRSAQDTAFKAASEQIAGLVKQQQATSTGVAKLAETSGSSGAALGKTISGLTGELATLKTALAEIGKSNGAQSAALAETKTQLLAQTDALAKQLAAVTAADPTQRLADLSAQYLQLRASLSTQTKRTEELTAQLKGLGEQIAALKPTPPPAAPVPAPAP